MDVDDHTEKAAQLALCFSVWSGKEMAAASNEVGKAVPIAQRIWTNEKETYHEGIFT